MVKAKLRFLLLLVPIIPIFGGIIYKDSFYYLISFISFLIVWFFINPNFLNKEIKVSKALHKLHNRVLPKRTKTFFPLDFLKIKNNFILVIVETGVLLCYLTYLGVYKLSNVKENNVYLKYLFSFYAYIQKQGLMLFVLLLIFFLVLVVFNKRIFNNFIHRLIYSLVIFTVSVIIIFNLSFLTTYFFAAGELNFLSIRSKMGMMTTGKDQINKKLKEYKKAPRIVGKDFKIDSNAIYQSLKLGGNKGNYYENSVIGTLPKFLVAAFSLPKDNIVLFGNYLLIREIDRKEIQTITPVVVKLLVKDYFSSKYIKDEPNYEVVGRQDYLKYREEDINKKIKKLDDAIDYINGEIAKAKQSLYEANSSIQQLNSGIADARNKIALNQSAINETNNSKSSYYSYCINAGYSFYGTFYHTFSQSYCDGQMSTYDSYIAQYQQNIRDWNTTIDDYQGKIGQWNNIVTYWQGQISDLNDASTILSGYKILLTSKKDETVYELGIFIPDKDIKLALDNVSSKSLADYLGTAVHEFLHYTSYISEEKSNNFEPFFEEALTEYFARKVIKKELNISTGQGYPLFTKVIDEMTKKVNESDLLDIYLTKDQNRLEQVLNQAYGNDFYKSSQTYFIQLYYSSANDMLKVANNIMFRIGGKHLQEKDLYSVSSELN